MMDILDTVFSKSLSASRSSLLEAGMMFHAQASLALTFQLELCIAVLDSYFIQYLTIYQI